MTLTMEQIQQAPVRLRGRVFQDFRIGQVIDHHWGRTICEGDNALFSTSTLQLNPLYFNRAHAGTCGHADVVVAPMLVFGVVFGLSVEDLSERGGAFLGIDDLVFETAVYPGATLTARSTVTGLRESRSDPAYGIATWHTEGFDATGRRVVHFLRSNLVIRGAAA